MFDAHLLFMPFVSNANVDPSSHQQVPTMSVQYSIFSVPELFNQQAVTGYTD